MSSLGIQSTVSNYVFRVLTVRKTQSFPNLQQYFHHLFFSSVPSPNSHTPGFFPQLFFSGSSVSTVRQQYFPSPNSHTMAPVPTVFFFASGVSTVR